MTEAEAVELLRKEVRALGVDVRVQPHWEDEDVIEIRAGVQEAERLATLLERARTCDATIEVGHETFTCWQEDQPWQEHDLHWALVCWPPCPSCLGLDEHRTDECVVVDTATIESVCLSWTEEDA